LTLAIAALVWLGETMQDWENALPKRLTVSFVHEGTEIMRCEQAYLAGEGDIRAWGQQLGGQMAGVLLQFDPLIRQEPGSITSDPKTGKLIKLYAVTFRLTALPEAKQADNAVNIEFLKIIKDGNKVVWERDTTTGEFKTYAKPV